MTPLYRHTGPDTAYLVKDYPYSFKLRCQIRYWLEHDKRKGWRFVSQTSNPKKTAGAAGDKLVWNKPKASTYATLAGCMYLNEDGHVKWDGLTEYSDVDKCLAFAESYLRADMSVLRYWAEKKAKYTLAYSKGEVTVTINGKPQPISDVEKREHEQEAVKWAALFDMLRKTGSNA